MKLIQDHGPDPIGLALGFGECAYRQFSSSTGIGGLAKWQNGRLDLLAVHSSNPRHGQFRSFISKCKRHYQTICCWHISQSWLKDCLARYGFSMEIEIQGDGEILEGMRWDR